MKNPNLVIDVGQTFIKFVVIDDSFKIIDHIILNNNLLIKRKKILNYNISKLKKIIISNLIKIFNKHKIKKVIPISHGSASFFIDDNGKCSSGPHFLQKINPSLSRSFFKVLKKNEYTHSLKLNSYHNLGKSFYYLIKNKKLLKINKIITLPALINYILTDKMYLDKSYLACHSFAWDFKKNKLISFFENNKKFFPKIYGSGKMIGYIKKIYSKRRKIQVHNGIHDTSGSYLALNRNFKSKNILIVNTGTYFIISKKIKFRKDIKNGFYYNYGADNNLYLCKRLNAGLIYQKYNPKMLLSKDDIKLSEANVFFQKNRRKKIVNPRVIKKNSQTKDFFKLNYLIAFKLAKEINLFMKKNSFNKVFIDGIFSKNTIFIFFLKQLVKKEIFITTNSFINCIGASTFFYKKKINLNYIKIR